MAKITRHVCDFNVNLREHDSHWFLNVEAKESNQSFDLCSNHLIAALTPILNANGFKSVTVRRDSGIEETPKVGEKVTTPGTRKGRQECPECGLDVANLSSHMKCMHEVTLREWKELHGFDPDQKGYVELTK